MAFPLLLFSIPAVSIGLFQLYFDRNFGTLFYAAQAGGDPLLWQHLFWVFGHPEVYVLILPAMGIVSEILPVSWSSSHSPTSSASRGLQRGSSAAA